MTDEHDRVAIGRDHSGRELAANGQHSDLAGQPSLHILPSTSPSNAFPPIALQPQAVLSTNASHFTEPDTLANAGGTDDGPTITSSRTKGNSANSNLSISLRDLSKEDTVQELQRPITSPVSPHLSQPPSSPLHPLRSLSASSTREDRIPHGRATLARKLHRQPESSGNAMELQPTAASAVQDAPHESFPGKNSDAMITKLPILKPAHNMATRPQSVQKPYESMALPLYENWIRDKAAHSRGFLLRLQAAKEKIRGKILRIKVIPPSSDGRHIHVDPNRKEPLEDERTGRGYISNTITSSRYTLWSFIPRQLFSQFSKLANFYFLCVSILQMIPGLSTTGQYTTIVPLVFFVVISMAKEGYDDLRRYRLDRAENGRTALVLNGQKAGATSTDSVSSSTRISDQRKRWVETKWEDIGVGDVVKLSRDEAAPADLAVLHADGAEGIAYVETMALDGETNLKSKQALPQLAKSCKTVEKIASCAAHIVVEDPNLDLYNFEGKVTVENETLPLTNNEIVYRGSILRNTCEATGIVVYSGEECKIRMNATKNPRIKAVSTKILSVRPADMRLQAFSSNRCE